MPRSFSCLLIRGLWPLGLLVLVSFPVSSASAGPSSVNPAAAYCQEMGYQYEIVRTEDGERGEVILPDGTRCDAWDFFRGKCGQEYSYCARLGYRVATRRIDRGSYVEECAVCLDELGEGIGTLFDLLPILDDDSLPSRSASTIPGSQDGGAWRPKRDGAYPASFNWCDQGGCTPIRNQGACGSCWAFATVGPLECNILIKDGQSVDLSEQWLNSCNQEGWNCDYGGFWAHDYHEWKGDPCGGTGAVLESDFPYGAADLPCDCPYPHPYHIQDWNYISGEYSLPTVDAIKQAILDWGPVSVYIDATSAFMGYTGGVFNNCGGTDMNHAVVLVGWDDNQGSQGVWFLRNSYGTGWGEGGYMRIEYGCNDVGYGGSWIAYEGIPDPRPDLTVVDILHTPEIPSSDDETKVRAIVRNEGTVLATSVYILFSFDGSPACTLDVGHVYPGDETWTDWCVLGSVPWGDHQVEACADPDNLVDEYDESNNCLTVELRVIEGGLEFLPSVAQIVVPEGDTASFDVRLSEPPSEALTAAVTSTGPDPDIQVTDGGTLTFTPENWDQPHPVTLYATPDADHEHGRSTLLIEGTGGPYLPDSTVLAIEQDSDVIVCVVASDGSGDHPTIQAAIDAGCDEIELTDGTFTGVGNRDIDYSGRQITIRSQSGDPSLCVIECEGTPGTPRRGFYFHSGETSDARLEGVTIRNGYREGGYPDGWGAGILCDNASPTIRNCVISNCTVSGSGSAGGGMVCRMSSAALVDCEFIDNQALSGGIAGLSIANGSDMVVRGCRFVGNATATGDCAGLAITASTADVDSCLILSNTAEDGKGGGLWCHSSTVTFDGCTVAGNNGHGLFCEVGAYPTLTNCTFYGNATHAGGAIHVRDSHAELNRTIIAFSTWRTALTCGGSGSASLSCCDLYGNPEGDWVGCIDSLNGVGGNFSADPLFCDAENNDFTIRNDSPCAPNPPLGRSCGLIGAWSVGCEAPPGETFVVHPDGSGDFATIQEAIDASWLGCVIELGDGVYTGDGNRDLDYGRRSITVRSQSGDPELCIIDCEGSPDSLHRGLNFHSGETADAVLEGVTVRNGYLDAEFPDGFGAGIFCDGSSPTVRNCVVESCMVAGSGMLGGGIYFGESSASVIDCRIRHNQALDGGVAGLSISNSTMTVRGCLIEGNSAPTGDCGGLAVTGSIVNVDSCRIVGNRAEIGKGGGIWCHSSTATFEFCTVARSIGHGLFSENDAHLSLANCTFFGDSTTAGGAIHVRNSDALLERTIIAFSRVREALTCGGTGSAVLLCCDLYGNPGGNWVGCIDNQLGVEGNITADPLFCDAAALDLTIRSDSPCAPFSPPNEQCDLIGANSIGCWLGACCTDNDGDGFPETCDLNTLAGCDAVGGTYQGNDTVCDPNPCPVPGACCLEDGDCVLSTEAECQGTFLGLDTVCDPNPCIWGACFDVLSCDCYLTGGAQQCEDGGTQFLFQGMGTACPADADTVVGACCIDDYCLLLSCAECAGVSGGYGYGFLGPGSSCDSVLCASSDASESAWIPRDFTLSTPMPNPTRQKVRMRVGLPEEMRIRVTVFDIAGRMVGQCFDQGLPAGVHTLHLAPVGRRDQRLPSGLYYLRVEGEKARWIRKVLVLE